MNNRRVKKGAIWRVIYPVLVYFGINLVVSFGAVMLISGSIIAEKGPEFLLGLETDPAVMQEFYSRIFEYSNELTLALSVIAIPLMLLFMNMDKKRLYREKEYVAWDTPKAVFFVSAFLAGVFAAVTCNNLISISGLTERFADESEMIAQLVYGGDLTIEILAVVILGPIAEELVFRGLVYKRMREISPFILSMLFSALLFGVYHQNWIQGIYAFLMGIVFAFVYEKFHSIWAPIAAHVGANALSVFLTESGVLEGLITGIIPYIIYVVIFAAATVAALWFINEKVRVHVLIPAGGEAQDDGTGTASGPEEQ